jgi:hypothetical protein
MTLRATGGRATAGGRGRLLVLWMIGSLLSFSAIRGYGPPPCGRAFTLWSPFRGFIAKLRASVSLNFTIGSMISRPLRKPGLASLVALAALTSVTPARAQQGYPGYQGSQSASPQSRNPVCPQLEGQLSAFDRGITDSSQSDQAKRLDDAVRKQQSDLDRLTAQARRSGCEGNGFFSLFTSQPAQCAPLNAQIQQARGNLDRTMSDLQRAQSNTGADHEGQRRSIIGALAQNDCGPQYRQLANQNQGGGLFDRLFGPGTILSPDSTPTAASGTYMTLCVRTCDGFYFPISYSALPNKFGEDAQTCQRLCPATEATLYSHRTTGEDITQAVSTNGRLYTEMANAFAYRKQFNPSCSCKAAGQTWADALKQIDDQTVERGDVVVTEERAKQLAQPQVDAQGKPIKPAPAGRPGTAPSQAVTVTPASANAAAPADTSGDTDTSKRHVRAVGPTFLPAH